MSYRCYCFPWSVVSIAFIAYVMFSKRGRQWQHLLLRPAGRGIMRRCRLRIHWKAMATFVVASCGQGNHAKMQVKDSLGGNSNVCCCARRAGKSCEDAGNRIHWEAMATFVVASCGSLLCYGATVVAHYRALAAERDLQKLLSWGHGVSFIREDFSSTQPKGKTDCT